MPGAGNNECARGTGSVRGLPSLLLIFLSGAAMATPPEPGSADAITWPMFRGGPALLGVAPVTLPAKLALAWTFKTQAPVKSSPAIAGGRVFIGSDDGNVYAVDLP